MAMADRSTRNQGGKTVRLSIREARELAECAIQKLNYERADASIIADHVMDAELCGYGYSGLAKILNVAADPRTAKPRSPITTVKETPYSALLDGGNNVGMLAMYRATEVAIEKSRQHGFALVGVYDSFVSGRNAYYLEMAAKANLVGIHVVSARPRVAPLGGTRPALGTNPIAFGVPSSRGPIIFDMGTAAIMASDLMLKARLHQQLPEGVALDASGLPTRDPDEVRSGSILTFGGYKGFGLSFCVQALGLLAGTASQKEKYYGFLMLVFDPNLLIPTNAFKQEVSNLVDRIKATPRQPGIEEIRIPSERAFSERTQRLKDGAIFIEQTVFDALNALVPTVPES